MSAWEGDLADLGKLADNIERLARVPSQASADAARGIAKAIDREFASGHDPYGKPWAPLAESTIEKKGDDAILIDTEDMRRSVDVRPLPGAGVSVSIGAEYAGFHQTGFHVGKTNVPARKVLPDAELPDTWDRAIGKALDAAWERAS